MGNDVLAKGGAKRAALVIGNSAYSASPLVNPVNDAKDVAKKLESLGFEVIQGLDLNLSDMANRLKKFGDTISPDLEVALFYFAGHAVQVDGENYLVPTGETIRSIEDLTRMSIPLNMILSEMNRSDVLTKIVILDACRNNPFAGISTYQSNGRSIEVDRGLKIVRSGLAAVRMAKQGTYLAYATDPGKVASDGDGRNGLYTSSLLEHIDMQSVSAETMFKLVRASVINNSQGQQIPWEHSSLTKDFYFNNPVSMILDNVERLIGEQRYGIAYRLAKEARSKALIEKDQKRSRLLIERIRNDLGN